MQTQLRPLFHLVYADFLERVRRYSFLVTLLGTIFVTYLFVPALDAPVYPLLNLGGYRPIYNSAWVGSAVTLLMTEFLPLFGFYLVKGSIERDRVTGVGQIIAATPVGKAIYTLGKWLSNLAVFVAMIAVTILASVVLQFVRAESFQLDLWALAAPFLLILLPAMAFVAALAVLFECVNALRGSAGNIVYFVAFTLVAGFTDFQGINTLWAGIYRGCATYFPDCYRFRQLDITDAPLAAMPTFQYPGMAWTLDILLQRLSWIAFGAAIALLASVFFHRFDSSKADQGIGTRFSESLKRALSALRPRPAHSDLDAASALPSAKPVRLSPLPASARLGRIAGRTFLQVVAAELRLTFKGVSWWWYLVAAALIGLPFFISPDEAHVFVLPFAWIWPLLLWSGMGVREVQHRTDLFVFAAPHPLRRQWVAIWLVGVVIAFVTGLGVLGRLALAGDWPGVFAVSVGGVFIPTLALALGCWSSSSKPFEAVYLFVWYMAVVQSQPYLDFMGRFSSAAGGHVLPWVYTGLTLAFGLAAILGRQRQIVK
jgi:hypothetical protein